MGTLQELVRYCSEEHHLGALLLTGEWGCGKTYLIDKNLSEALRETHFIVRVSLLGADSVEALNSAVRTQWLQKCTPFLGKLKQERDKMKTGGSIFSVVNKVLGSLYPVSGSIASAFSSVDPLEYIPLEPVVEDFHNKGVKKRVVLVFDDLDRSRLDMGNLFGTITEYCENKGFTTVVIAEEGFIRSASKLDPAIYKMMKEKTFARVVRYVPDYQAIVHSIVTQSPWPSEEYAAYLSEKEQLICDVFASDYADRKAEIGKYHNFRSLICALQEFSRLYEMLTERQAGDIDRYLYSFIAYILISRNGLKKNGQLCFDYGEEDIRRLYPGYCPELLPECIRQWIEDGVWDEAAIGAFFNEQFGEAEPEALPPA